MKYTNTFGIHFIIRLPKQRKGSKALIYARLTVNGKRTEISLKQKVEAKAWDDVRGRVRGKTAESNKLNSYLERVRTIISDGYYDLIQKRKPVTVDSVKSLFVGVEEETLTLSKLIEYHQEVAVGKLAPDTMKNYGTTQRYLQKFLRENYSGMIFYFKN